MHSASVNRFRDKLKAFVEQVVSDHGLLNVTRRSGEAFVVMNADDWESEQETLYVLQNSALMRQLAESAATHTKGADIPPRMRKLMRSLEFLKIAFRGVSS